MGGWGAAIGWEDGGERMMDDRMGRGDRMGLWEK